MKCYVSALAALAVALPAFAIGESAQAQVLTRSNQNKPQAKLLSTYTAQPTLTRRDPAVQPACCGNDGPYPGPGPSGCNDSCCDGSYFDGGCCPDSCCSCDSPCCDSCGPGCGSCGWCNWCDLFRGPGGSRPWFFTGDYLYVRANFSEAPAFEVHESSTPNVTDTFHDFDYGYQSSYRFGGGYQLPCCGEQVRFLFTRMSSSADASASSPTDSIRGPFDTDPGPGGNFTAHSQVDTWTYDVEFAKTIPLGGCGHGSCAMPAWDITWEGGFRFAQVRNTRNYLGVPEATQESPTLSANTSLNFQGGGPRFGVEGRRYFGQRQWISTYLKGDISLLMGHVDVLDHHLTSDTGSVIDQSARFRNIIPVTEIEAGLTGQLTRSVTLTAGYLFSAWNDLGFRDEFNMTNTTALNTSYDDSNIMSFDGFFARLEIDF
jgi:hypothetical protein